MTILKTCAAIACLLVATPSVSAYGAWLAYINDYPGTSGDLTFCDESASGADLELSANGGWTRTTTANTATLETHFKMVEAGGTDDYGKSDYQDIAYFCGHGDYVGTEEIGLVRFHNNVEANDLIAAEVRYGYHAEWVAFDASNVLHRSASSFLAWSSWYTNAHQNLHLLIGWYDSPLDNPTGYKWFDEMVLWGGSDGGGSSIKTAWWAAAGGCYGQPSGMTGAILGETSAQGSDYLWGEGTVQPGASHDGTYTYWQHDC